MHLARSSFSLGKQTQRVQREEKKLCKLPFPLMLINPGVLAHKIKRNKIKLKLAPLGSWEALRLLEGACTGRGLGDGNAPSSLCVASLPQLPFDDGVTCSARVAAVPRGQWAIFLRTMHFDSGHSPMMWASFFLQGHIAPTQLIQHEYCHLLCVNSTGVLLDMQMSQCGASPRGIHDPIAVKRPTLEANREQFSDKVYELSTEFYSLHRFPLSSSSFLELSLRTKCFKAPSIHFLASVTSLPGK